MVYTRGDNKFPMINKLRHTRASTQSNLINHRSNDITFIWSHMSRECVGHKWGLWYHAFPR